MGFLWITTLLWAFSFSLIGVYLAGQVDSYFSVLVRVALAFGVFAPFLAKARIPASLAARLMGIGALQLGVMYLFYYNAFLHLSVPEVLVFTIFTPLYVTLLYDLLHRRFSAFYLLTAALAVMGTGIIRFDSIADDFLLGFALVQGSNLAFAFGQVAYKTVVERAGAMPPQHQVFGYFFLGATLVGALAWFALGEPVYPSTGIQWGVLLWLGVGASGMGYFLWNRGATRVNPGALAIMNNALVPAGLLVNWALWNRQADFARLLLGGGLIFGALALNEWVRGRGARPAS